MTAPTAVDDAPSRTARLRCSAKLLALVAVFAVVSFTASAFNSTRTTSTSTADRVSGSASGPLGSDLAGQFLVSGSSTVFPIVQRQAEEFAADQPGVAIAVEGPGSGDGAKKFCAGDAPIANASRLFKEQELEICEANGVDYIEIRRGIDGISVITSPTNDVIECLSFNDLYALLSEESSQTNSWADANRLTSTWDGQTFPDVRLDVFGPGEESGTFDSFAEIVIDAVAKGKTGLDVETHEFVETIRPDYTSSPDDNVVVEGVEASQYSLGWVGYAYARESERAGQAKLVQVSHDDNGNCVAPTPETIASAEFPIARFLYTYVNADAANDNPAVAAFVDYMLSDRGYEAVAAVGYIDMPDIDIAKANEIWANRTTGRSWE